MSDEKGLTEAEIEKRNLHTLRENPHFKKFVLGTIRDDFSEQVARVSNPDLPESAFASERGVLQYISSLYETLAGEAIV